MNATPNKNEIILIGQMIEIGMKVFDKKKKEFKAMKTEASQIEIKAVSDTIAIKAASALRKKLKAARCEITRQGKELRKPLTEMAAQITNLENELIEIIRPAENHLIDREQWVADEIARIERERAEREAARINNRITQLAQYGYSVDTAVLAGLDDQTFAAVLNQASANFEIDRASRSVDDQVSDLQKRVQMIADDEIAKIENDQKNIVVDLGKVTGANGSLSDRERLMIYAEQLRLTIDLAPVLSNPEALDIIDTAKKLMHHVSKMLAEAVETIS